MPHNKFHKLEELGFFIALMVASIVIPLGLISIIGRIILLFK
jgi:hypothetical protein